MVLPDWQHPESKQGESRDVEAQQLLTHHYWLTNTRIPLTFLDATVATREPIARLSAAPLQEDLVATDIEIKNGHIICVQPAGMATGSESPVADLQQGLVWPCFVDIHTHLDKGHIWERAPNPDGSFDQALGAIAADQKQHWSAEDVYRRMEFGLKCSYAHGTRAIRTHLDAFGRQGEISLEVFKTLQQEWTGKLDLEAVCLVTLDYFQTPAGEQLADLVVEIGGILGGVAYMGPELDAQLDIAFTFAKERGLDLDFHTDESLNPADMTLRHVAMAKLRHDFGGKVVCAHCCSLSAQTPEVAADTMDWVQAAEIGIVSLPLCNLYLQDRHPERTPRSRGVTLLHELRRRGIPIALASDNCRDPFFAYGDHDGLEVFTQSARIGHLDRPYGDWPQTLTRTPAEMMGLPEAGRIGVGLPADLVLFKARTFNELMSRPQCDRVVLRNGRAIDTTLPDYAELDDLVVR